MTGDYVVEPHLVNDILATSFFFLRENGEKFINSNEITVQRLQNQRK